MKTSWLRSGRARTALAKASKQGAWDEVVAILRKNARLVNSSRLDSDSLFAPLHQAAYNNAPSGVIVDLVRLGAWRTLENARGERPIDIAVRKGNKKLVPPLEPQLRREIPIGILRVVERHFHDVILSRARALVQEQSMRLPRLAPLLEIDEPKMWFPIPGTYGGFSYWLEKDGIDPVLVAESWCRVVEGSGQRHRIGSRGFSKVAEGFV